MWYPYPLFIEKSNIMKVENTSELIEVDKCEIFVCNCREQVNSSGKIIIGTDGQSIVSSSIIHLPLDTEVIQVGSIIKVYNADQSLRLKGKVLRFSKDSMHCRLWV